MKLKTSSIIIPVIIFLATATLFPTRFQEEDARAKARGVIQAAIEAMGGEAYLNVKNSVSTGRYFGFRKDRKSFARYQDWTVYEPVKSRTQFGKGNNRFVQIYNLDLKQGWTIEGKEYVEEIKEDLVEEFYTRTVKRDMDYIFKKRLDEEGMSFFYYSPDEVSGTGNFEAVEILDEENYSIVVFFDVETHLPGKIESTVTNKMGVRQKSERELANWHRIQGLNVPLRSDYYLDGEVVAQYFIEEIQFNQVIPEEYFLEPVIDD
jgi:hypothetical protein